MRKNAINENIDRIVSLFETARYFNNDSTEDKSADLEKLKETKLTIASLWPNSAYQITKFELD